MAVLPSSTVMTPSRPTFSTASARRLPIVGSLLAEIVPTCAISSFFETGRESLVVSSVTAASTAFSIPRRTAVGLAPTLTIRSPSRKMARARMVAVVVPSPATSEVFDATTFTSLAPIFSNGSTSSISFETVTPSLVTVGPPNDLLMITFRPVGPSVVPTAWARTSTPSSIFRRAASEKSNCLGTGRAPMGSGRLVEWSVVSGQWSE